MGIHTTYTPEQAASICERISKGTTLAQICRDDGIGRTTVYEWLKEHSAFAERFARARELGFDAIADDCMDIADDGSNDWMLSNKPDDERYVLNGEHVQRSKLRIESRLKLLAKWSPKYREQLDMKVEGKVDVAATLYEARKRARKAESDKPLTPEDLL